MTLPCHLPPSQPSCNLSAQRRTEGTLLGFFGQTCLFLLSINTQSNQELSWLIFPPHSCANTYLGDSASKMETFSKIQHGGDMLRANTFGLICLFSQKHLYFCISFPGKGVGNRGGGYGIKHARRVRIHI